MTTIRKCGAADRSAVHSIINDAARAYRGVIPDDRWREPYMSRDELERELEDGVVFWGAEQGGALVGVMGLQDKGDVVLIRHAYTITARRNQGIGSRLLFFLESGVDKPLLVGTWAAAGWAVSFYQRNGYRLLDEQEKNAMLRKYWTIPERQVETSVVLAKFRNPPAKRNGLGSFVRASEDAGPAK